jgi:fluoride ion exporter CrcB/FEX
MGNFLYGQIKFWFSSEFFAVGLSAFAGVAVRVALKNFFSGAGQSNTSTGNGPFMQIFYAQNYLLANFLGCYIMAFCVHHMKAISAVSLPLYKALTTGFCGCLTTYASWMNDAVDAKFNMFWYQVLTMIWLEFFLTWSAFTFGFATAKIQLSMQQLPIIRMIVEGIKRGFANIQSKKKNPGVEQKSNSVELEEADSTLTNATMDTPHTDDHLHMSSLPVSLGSKPRDLESNSSYSKSKSSVPKRIDRSYTLDDGITLDAVASRISIWREDGPQEMITHNLHQLEHLSLPKSSELYNIRETLTHRQSELRASMSNRNTLGGLKNRIRASTMAAVNEDDEESMSGNARPSLADNPLHTKVHFAQPTADTSSSISTKDTVKSGSKHSKQNVTLALEAVNNNNDNNNNDDQASATKTQDEAILIEQPLTQFEWWLDFFQTHEFTIWATLFTMIAAAIWIGLFFIPDSEVYNNATYKETYRAVALAPLGAWLRWGLTRFPQIKGAWPEMNPQTMLANLIAVTFGCLLLVFATGPWVDPINDGK